MRYSFFIFFIFILFSLFSQKKEIDKANSVDYIFISNNLLKSKKILEENIKKAKAIKYKKGEAESYQKLSTVYSLLGNYDLAVKYNFEALKLFEKLRNYDMLAVTYADLGFRLKYVNKKQAISYFRNAIEIGENHQIGNSLASIYNNYSELLKDIAIDSAEYFALKGLSLVKLHKDLVGIPFSYNRLVEIYIKKREFDKAFYNLEKSDKIRFSKSDSAGIADNIAYRGDIFYEIPILDSAVFYYEKSLPIAMRCKYNSLERFCLERLTQLLEKKNDFQKSLKYHKRFQFLKDSALNINVQNEISNIGIKYDTEKTKRLLAENQIKLSTRQKWLTLSISGFFFLSILIVFVFRYQKIKRNNQVKEVILNQELEKTILAKEFGDEKIRIARELHDNIGSHLTFMISSLDNLSYVQQQDKIDKIVDLSNFGRETMKELRDTIWAMNHDDGDLDQLLTRIAALRSVLPANLEVQIDSTIDKNFILSGIQLLNLYRIVQEFIQNTIKYADATQVNVSFSNDNSRIILTLSDNGNGFDIATIHFGNGILNMKRRCEDLFGNFEISSSSDGTSITCQIPALKKGLD